MPVTLDTSALIRFFTNDVPSKAERVEEIFEKEKQIIIPDVIFPELEYVLDRGYNLSRNKIIKAYRFLLAQQNIQTSPHIKKAVEIFQETTLDMADCIIASSSLKGSLASFDKDLLKVEGVTPHWK